MSFLSAAILSVVILLAPGVLVALLSGERTQDIEAIAIYRSTEEFQGEIDEAAIKFNVTDPATIRKLLSSIDFQSSRDGSRLKSKTNAFVYLKSKAGVVEAYEIYLTWQYFAHQGKRARSYPIDQEGQRLFASLAQ